MFERFTDRARRVVVLAQEEGRMLGHAYIGTEHLLLGLISEGEGLAARHLASAGVTLDVARREVEKEASPGNAAETPRHVPFTPGSKRVLEHSLREAQRLGHNSIDTEHILLGLLDEPDGVAAVVLNRLAGDTEVLRGSVLERIGSARVDEPTSPCCPRCRAELTKTLTYRKIEAREHEGDDVRVVVVTYCGACGTALGAQ